MLGTDIVEISRIKKALENESFKLRVYTSREIEELEKKGVNKYSSYAGRFCAKEAISKAFGTGIKNFNFCDIEILRDENGKPIVKTYNNLKKICIDYNVLEIQVSISHSKNYAVANAIVIVKE